MYNCQKFSTPSMSILTAANVNVSNVVYVEATAIFTGTEVSSLRWKILYYIANVGIATWACVRLFDHTTVQSELVA